MLNTQRYLIELGSSIALYAITLIVSLSFLQAYPDTPWRVLIAISPSVPALLAAVAVIRALKDLDELQQKIQLLGFACSFLIVGLVTFTYGFLENIGFPHIPYVWVFPVMIATWGLVTPLVSRVYQ